MASIPNNQITHAELVLKGVVAAAGSTSKNMNLVMHYRRTANVLTINKTNLANAWLTANRALFTLTVSLRLVLSGLAVRWIDDALDAPVLTSDTHAGAVTGDSMPLTASAYLKLSTGLRGKSYRGSHHIFPMAESQTTVLTDDIWNAAALTTLGNLATGLLANVTDSDGNVWVPQVLSKKLSQLQRNPTTVVANDVISISVAKRVGNMRHRRVAQLY